MSQFNISFDPKPVGVTALYQFNFIDQLDVGEEIDSAIVTCTVYSGTDAAPEDMISGSATISGTTVSQMITAGTEGVVYYLTCTAVTDDGKTLQLIGFLAVVPPVV